MYTVTRLCTGRKGSHFKKLFLAIPGRNYQSVVPGISMVFNQHSYCTGSLKRKYLDRNCIVYEIFKFNKVKLYSNKMRVGLNKYNNIASSSIVAMILQMNNQAATRHHYHVKNTLTCSQNAQHARTAARTHARMPYRVK